MIKNNQETKPGSPEHATTNMCHSARYNQYYLTRDQGELETMTKKVQGPDRSKLGSKIERASKKLQEEERNLNLLPVYNW